MITMTEYLDKKIFEKFKNHCDNVDPKEASMYEPIALIHSLRNNSARHAADASSPYKDSTAQQLYLLIYAYAYGFEYQSMYSAFIDDLLENKETKEISVVSLGCGAMLDYWALVCMLDKRNASRLDIKYHGIDAIAWEDRLDAEALGQDKENFKFFPVSFEKFFGKEAFVREDFERAGFKKEDFDEAANEFNTHDVYFFPKSISEISAKKGEDGKSIIDKLLDNLSGRRTDSPIFFCISLQKGSSGLGSSDVAKVKNIMEKLGNKGFSVEYIKCITDKKQTIENLQNVLETELDIDNSTELVKRVCEKGNAKKIYETDISGVLEYPPYPSDVEDSMPQYIKMLRAKCNNRLCEECEKKLGSNDRAILCKDFNISTIKNPMTNLDKICDLIIKFKKVEKTTP